MRRVLVGALVLGGATGGAADVAATTCSTPPTVVIPGARETAPLDTHVWIYGWEEPGDPHQFELRSSPSGKSPGEAIPVKAQRTATGENTFVVELVPARALSPKTRFEVWSLAKETRLVGTLRTGTSRDSRAPSWTGAEKVEPILPKPGKTKPKRRVIVLTDEVGLRVVGPRAKDTEGRVLYAAWKGDAGKPIDFGRPPDGWAYDTDPTSSIVVILGSPGTCFPATFDVPKDATEIQIGLAAVDLAGNRGPTSEHRVKL